MDEINQMFSGGNTIQFEFSLKLFRENLDVEGGTKLAAHLSFIGLICLKTLYCICDNIINYSDSVLKLFFVTSYLGVI